MTEIVKSMVKDKNRRSKLVTRIYTALTQRIEAGEWGYGAMLPGENELCEVYSVSRGTLRKVLDIFEKESILRREQGRGTFIARAGINKQTGLIQHASISFIVPYVRDSFLPSILLGLESLARANGYAVWFNHVENDLDKQDQAIRTVIQQGVSGIVLYPVNSTEATPALFELVQQNYPLVLVDRYIRGFNTDYVTSDNMGGGLRATQHLLGLGHRRIVFLSWKEMATSMEHRRAGYRQALKEAGIRLDSELEWEVAGYPEVDQTALVELLQRPNRPSAIFAANDQLALAIERAARELKLIIPDDISLVGFDNLDISANVDVPLTTVAQSAFEIGRTAGEMIIARIARVTTSIQRRILPVQLVIRRSCGAYQL